MSAAKARGFTFELVPMVGRSVNEEEILARVAHDPRVKGVALSWVSFWSGYRIDIARMGAACRANGIWLAVDAIQGLGACVLDVKAAQVDILSTGAQKWLCSPWGTGFAYVRRELISQLEPPAAGWLSQATAGDFAKFLDYDPAWRSDAQRFEVGSLPMQDFIGMNATFELFQGIGPTHVEQHVRALTRQLLSWAETRSDITCFTPTHDAHRAGIVALATPDLQGDSQRLREARVTHAVREGAIRIAPHFHNTLEDVDHVIGVLGR
jgi:selenocysteine lyase/cysteine desulfurase